MNALLLIIAIVLIVAKIRPKISTLISWKRSALIAGIYLAVLILLVPVMYLLPGKDFKQLVRSTNNTVILPQLDAKNLDKLYKNSNQAFQFDKKTLGFKVADNTGYNQIYVERKGLDDGKIEISIYAATQVFAGIDFTKLILPPDVSIKNGILTIKSHQQKLDFKKFNPDFILDQFKPDNIGYNGGMFGWKAVYVRVPKSLEIDKGTYNVNIISR